MSSGNSLAGLVRQVRSADGNEAADSELLERYARTREEAAFALLVRRYGGLVLSVARRQLPVAHAEDVFQATFLALARAAGRLEKRSLANWLFTVALRQSRKLLARTSRREALERSAATPREGTDPLEEITGRELLQAIDDELSRLPERYRLPLLLCGVQGMSREEAAAVLGWSQGVLKGRLERGRKRLAARLTARGLAPSAILLSPLASAVVPSELLARTIALAASPWAESVSPTVASLANSGAPRAIWLVAFAGCALAVGFVGWALASGSKSVEEPTPRQQSARTQPAAATQPDDEDALPNGSYLRLGTDRFRHGTTIQNLSISADGKLAVAGSGTRRFGTLRLYDLKTGRVLATLAEQHEYVVAVALSPDGKTVAVKRGDHAVHFYDAATGQPTGRIPYPTANPSSMTDWLRYSPDGKRLLVGSATGDGVHLIDRDKLDVVRTFKHDKVVFDAAFSPDGKLLAAGGYDRDKNAYFARLWEANTGAELRRFVFGNGGIRSLAFSPDGKTLAVGGDGPASAKLFDVATARERLKFTLPNASSVRSLAFAPDGLTLAASGGNSTRLFDTATGKEKLTIDRAAIGLRFAPDGALLFGAVSGTIYRWDVKSGRALTPESADGVIDQIELSGDGKQLVVRGQDGDAHVWNLVTGEHERRVSVAWQRGLALSPDGRFLVWPIADEKIKYKDAGRPNTIYTGHRLQMLDLTTGKSVDRFGGFEGDAHDLFFTPDGNTLVTVDHRDATVWFWDVATGKTTRSFRALRDNEKERQNHVWHARLSPDGKTLAVTYQPSGRGIFSPFAVRLWDTSTGKELHDLVGHHSYVEAMAFSPDGNYLVTGGEALQKFAQQQLKLPPDQVFVWDVGNGEAVARLPIGGTSAAFASDGKTLAVSTETGAIELWDTATWKRRGEFRGHRDRVTALAPGPEGRLFSGGVDTTVLAWNTRIAK